MAEALIKVKDLPNGEVEMEVKFNPQVDNKSQAHQLVSEFVKYANLKKIESD